MKVFVAVALGWDVDGCPSPFYEYIDGVFASREVAEEYVRAAKAAFVPTGSLTREWQIEAYDVRDAA